MRWLVAPLMIAALGVCGWFVIGIRQAQDLSAATSIVAAGHAAGPGRLAAAAADLRSAAFLDPDQEVNILRGRLTIARGQVALARRILASVTRAEPMNLEAWIWFTGASLGSPREGRIGTARIAQLDPLDAHLVRR
jgi:hypothetical protein